MSNNGRCECELSFSCDEKPEETTKGTTIPITKSTSATTTETKTTSKLTTKSSTKLTPTTKIDEESTKISTEGPTSSKFLTLNRPSFLVH